MKGEKVSGLAIEASHDTKRRLKTPKDLRGGALFQK